jgi:hypothetical protein
MSFDVDLTNYITVNECLAVFLRIPGVPGSKLGTGTGYSD